MYKSAKFINISSIFSHCLLPLSISKLLGSLIDKLRDSHHPHRPVTDSAKMTDPNRAEQLEGLRNITTNQDFYEKLAAGHSASASSASPQSANGTFNVQYIPVPITIKAQLGSPTALAIGAFATTLTTLSFALMGWRGMSVTNAFIGNFFGVAGIGMVISAQWEIVLGNTYAYTVLSAFGLFYLGFGIIVTPFFGVAQAYGGTDTPEYYNALGFFVLSMLLILLSRSISMLTSETSVGRLQLLLPHRIGSAERCLLRNFLHRSAGFHLGLRRLLPQCRWIYRDRDCSQYGRWSIRFRFWDAGVLYCGESHVSGGFRRQLPYGRHEPVLQEEDTLIDCKHVLCRLLDDELHMPLSRASHLALLEPALTDI
jgi:succinate-acetate transporter protein